MSSPIKGHNTFISATIPSKNLANPLQIVGGCVEYFAFQRQSIRGNFACVQITSISVIASIKVLSVV